MNITVFKGTKEIGGTCIQIESQNKTKILLDLGLPLEENSSTEYIDTIKDIDAIFLSHTHLDHYGLIHKYKEHTSIYMGFLSYKFLETSDNKIDKSKIKTFVDIPNTTKKETIIINNDMKITPYYMDHSSIEAFLFLIECDNKKVIYTGDFRDTGYTGLKAIRALNKNEELKNADYIFIEGTNINREYYEFNTERRIEEKLEEIFKQQENISFLYGAKSNIDRIIATFKSCIKANKILIVDVYTAYIIYIASLKSKKLDILNSKNIKIYKNNKYDKYIQKIKNINNNEKFFEKINKNKLNKNNFYSNLNDYVYYNGISKKLLTHLIKISEKEINIIYSMWLGYLKDETFNSIVKDYIEIDANDKIISKNKKIKAYYAHTTGHATKELLLKVVKDLEPKNIVPVHTDKPENLKKYFNQNGLNNIKLFEDNKIYKV